MRHFFHDNSDDDNFDDARQLPLGTTEKLEHPRAKRNAVSSTSRSATMISSLLAIVWKVNDAFPCFFVLLISAKSAKSYLIKNIVKNKKIIYVYI